jgi:hypothetical protein
MAYSIKDNMKLELDSIESTNDSKLKTIIFTHGGGRFGNQMFSYAHLFAFSLEHKNIDFINMSFWEYANLLEIGEKDAICTKSLDLTRYKYLRFLHALCAKFNVKNDSISKKIIIHILHLYGRNPFSKYYRAQSISTIEGGLLAAQKIQGFDLANIESFTTINNATTTVLSGWDICNWQLVEKHQNQIRTLLKIKQKYVDISNLFMLDKREKYDFIVGVMIRQGDYQFWENGRHYFSTQQYSLWFDRLSEIFSSRGTIGFIVASDTPQDLNDFSNQNIHFTTGIAGGTGHYLESLLELSRCDLIVSPPSSFSLWAAFVGNIPMMLLSDLFGGDTQNQHQDSIKEW